MKEFGFLAVLRFRKTIAPVALIAATAAMCTASAAYPPGTTLIVGAPVPLAPGVFSVAMSSVAADVNADALPDLVLGFNFSSPVVYLNNGTATPFEGVEGLRVSATDPQQWAYVADMNGDDAPDIVAAGFNHPTKLYLNNGTANPFSGVTGGNVGTVADDSTAAIGIADVNGDTLPDIAVANTNHLNSRVYLNNGTAAPFAGVTPLNIGAEVAYANDVELVDINGDSRPDAVLAFLAIVQDEPTGVLIYLHDGTADPFGAVTPLVLLADGGALRVHTVDLDGDSKLDLIASGDLNSGNHVFLNTGSSTQPYDSEASLTQLPDLGTCLGVTAADVNGDSLPDAGRSPTRRPAHLSALSI